MTIGTVRFLTSVKTMATENLIDRNVDVNPQNVVSELCRFRDLLDEEIKTLEGQIKDSK